MKTAAQLSLLDSRDEAPTAAPARSRPVIEGAFNVFVAGLEKPDAKPCDSCAEDARCVGPLPIPGSSPAEAEARAAVLAGVDDSACLALPAHEGDWCDELMALLDEANARAEADLQHLRGIHAKILGCSIEELDARVAADEAALRAALPPRAPRSTSRRGVKASKAAPAPCTPAASALPMTRLDDRQRELLGLVHVVKNVAVYTREERIPDWDALKSVLVALGGTWRSKKGFVFPDDIDAAERVRLAIATGEILDPRAADFFPRTNLNYLQCAVLSRIKLTCLATV